MALSCEQGLAYLKQDKVKELITKECDDGNAAACHVAGFVYETDEGVKQDKSKAVELYTKSCDGGDATGCGSLGAMY